MAADPITVWGLFVESYHAVTALAQEDMVAALDLPWTWFEVLVRLDRSGGSLAHDDLVTQLRYLSGGPAGLLARIQDVGLVDAHGGDGALRVSLTTEGRDLITRAMAVHRATLQRCLVALFDQNSLTTLEGMLRTVRDHNFPDADALQG